MLPDHGSIFFCAGEEAYSYDGETISGLEGKNQIRAGQLTAKAQNDNGAYEDWKLLFASASENQKQGAFYRYQSDRNEVWACNTEKRVKLTVKNGEEPVVGAIEATWKLASRSAGNSAV